jgi:ribonuclease Z
MATNMTPFIRRVLWIFLVVLLLASLAFALRRELGMQLFAYMAQRNAEALAAPSLADGLHLFVCGSGSPMPDSERAGPCVGILAGERAFVVDAGSGGPGKLARMGFPLGSLDGVLLTHLHSDHIDALGELTLLDWVGAEGREQPLDVWGPPGTPEVVAGFNAAYRIDSGYRIAHHGESVAPPAGFGAVGRGLDIPGDEPGVTVLEEGPLRIRAIRVDHAPVAQAYAYRFDYHDRSLVISGDTVASETLAAQSRAADLLLHEALQPAMVSALGEAMRGVGRHNTARIMSDILDYHSSPEEAAQVAADAGVRALVLTHLVPPLPSRLLAPAFLGDAGKHFDGSLRIAEDGLRVSLPTGSELIDYRELF